MAGTETAKKQRRRGPGRPFKKGQSGNPKGRPRESLAEAVRRKWPNDKLVEVVSKLARSKNEATRQRAVEWLADRGHGRAPQVIVDLPPGDDAAPIDWGAVPLERRKKLLEALQAADEIALPSEGDGRDDH